jgi:hypothetical protein
VLVVSAVALSAFTGILLTTGDAGVRVAAILVLPVSLVAFYIAGAGWVRGRTPQDSELIAAVNEITYELGQSLVDLRQRTLPRGIVEPYESEFAGWPSHGDSGVLGTLSSVYDYFNALEAERLIILGDGGAGKTSLGLDLALQIVRGGHENETTLTKFSIPFRVNLSSFVPLENHASSDSTELSRRLRAWIISEFRAATNQPAFIVKALVRRQILLPILDGLDEMDRDDSPPVNALALLRALNHPTEFGYPSTVLICRTERYRVIAENSGIIEPLRAATTIQMLPLEMTNVLNYIARQTALRPDAQEWGFVVDRLRHSLDGPLARAITRPLDLYLLLSAPVGSLATLPDEPDGIRLSLIDSLLPSLTTRDVPATSYTATAVSRWLATLASGLRRQEELGGSATDLDIPELWKLGGSRLPRLASAVTFLLVGLALIMAPFGWARYSRHAWLPLNGRQWFIDTTGVALILIATVRSLVSRDRLVRMDFGAIARQSGRRIVARYMQAFFVIGVVFGVFFFILFGIAFAISFCLALSIALGLLFGLMRAPALVAAPRKFVRDCMFAEFFILFECSLIYGLTNGLANGLSRNAYGGLVFGLAYGWLFSMAVRADTPWVRYVLVNVALASRGRLPARLAPFLEWAADDAGLLRQSGTRIQFRHLVLRDYFEMYGQRADQPSQ